MGGFFTEIGGQERDRIAALDAASGEPLAWNPGTDNAVLALAVTASTVYAGGSFEEIGGEERKMIAALDAGTGSVDEEWDPSANGVVRALALSGSTLYVGGFFTEIGGQERDRVAALEPGAPLSASGQKASRPMIENPIQIP